MAKKKAEPKQDDDKSTPIFWISGNAYQSRKALDSICKCVQNPEIIVLDASQMDASRMVIHLKTPSIFNDNPRIIRIKGVPANYELLVQHLHLARNDNIIVFEGPIGYWSGRRFVSLKTSKLYKRISEIKNPSPKNRLLHFPEEFVSEREGFEWIEKVCQEQGKSIDIETAKMLLHLKGMNIDLIHSEVLKICDYQTGNKIIPSDVEECCTLDTTKTVWDLIDLLLELKYDESIRCLERIMDEATTDRNLKGEVQGMLGGMVHAFNFLLLMRTSDCKDAYSAKQVTSGIKKVKKEDEDEKQLYDAYYVSRMYGKPGFKSALGWNPRKLYNLMDCLLEARTKTRMADDNAFIRTCMTGIVMVVCDRMNRERFLSMLN